MLQTIDAMRDIDVRTVDTGSLVDLREVVVNTSMPREARLLDYVEQIRNPCCFKLGKTVVKVSFSDTEATLEDCLERYLLSL